MDNFSDAFTKLPFTQIKTSTEAGVGHIMLARPDRGNALNPTMVRELHEAFKGMVAAGANLILLSGEGRHFCTGFDLSDLDQCTDGDLLLRFVKIEQLLQAVHKAPVTTLAVGKGRVMGAGADLFVACDRRVATDGISFSFPGAGFGLVLGTDRLRARVGRDHARRIVTLSETVDVQRAMAIGLATDLGDDNDVKGWTAAIVERSSALGRETVASLYDATNDECGDAQLAALVRSAAQPGLKARIEAYKAYVAARKGTS